MDALYFAFANHVLKNTLPMFSRQSKRIYPTNTALTLGIFHDCF